MKTNYCFVMRVTVGITRTVSNHHWNKYLMGIGSAGNVSIKRREIEGASFAEKGIYRSATLVA